MTNPNMANNYNPNKPHDQTFTNTFVSRTNNTTTLNEAGSHPAALRSAGSPDARVGIRGGGVSHETALPEIWVDEAVPDAAVPAIEIYREACQNFSMPSGPAEHVELPKSWLHEMHQADASFPRVAYSTTRDGSGFTCTARCGEVWLRATAGSIKDAETLGASLLVSIFLAARLRVKRRMVEPRDVHPPAAAPVVSRERQAHRTAAERLLAAAAAAAFALDPDLSGTIKQGSFNPYGNGQWLIVAVLLALVMSVTAQVTATVPAVSTIDETCLLTTCLRSQTITVTGVTSTSELNICWGMTACSTSTMVLSGGTYMSVGRNGVTMPGVGNVVTADLFVWDNIKFPVATASGVCFSKPGGCLTVRGGPTSITHTQFTQGSTVAQSWVSVAVSNPATQAVSGTVTATVAPNPLPVTLSGTPTVLIGNQPIATVGSVFVQGTVQVEGTAMPTKPVWTSPYSQTQEDIGLAGAEASKGDGPDEWEVVVSGIRVVVSDAQVDEAMERVSSLLAERAKRGSGEVRLAALRLRELFAFCDADYSMVEKAPARPTQEVKQPHGSGGGGSQIQRENAKKYVADDNTKYLERAKAQAASFASDAAAAIWALTSDDKASWIRSVLSFCRPRNIELPSAFVIDAVLHRQSSAYEARRHAQYLGLDTNADVQVAYQRRFEEVLGSPVEDDRAAASSDQEAIGLLGAGAKKGDGPRVPAHGQAAIGMLGAGASKGDGPPKNVSGGTAAAAREMSDILQAMSAGTLLAAGFGGLSGARFSFENLLSITNNVDRAEVPRTFEPVTALVPQGYTRNENNTVSTTSQSAFPLEMPLWPVTVRSQGGAINNTGRGLPTQTTINLNSGGEPMAVTNLATRYSMVYASGVNAQIKRFAVTGTGFPETVVQALIKTSVGVMQLEMMYVKLAQILIFASYFDREPIESNANLVVPLVSPNSLWNGVPSINGSAWFGETNAQPFPCDNGNPNQPVFPYGGARGTLSFHVCLETMTVAQRENFICVTPTFLTLFAGSTQQAALALLIALIAPWPYALFSLQVGTSNTGGGGAGQEKYWLPALGAGGLDDIAILLSLQSTSSEPPGTDTSARAASDIVPTWGPRGSPDGTVLAGTVIQTAFLGAGSPGPIALVDYLWSWTFTGANTGLFQWSRSTVLAALSSMISLTGTENQWHTAYEKVAYAYTNYRPHEWTDADAPNLFDPFNANSFYLRPDSSQVPVSSGTWPMRSGITPLFYVGETTLLTLNQMMVGLCVSPNTALWPMPNQWLMPYNHFFAMLVGRVYAATHTLMYARLGLSAGAYTGVRTRTDLQAVSNIVRGMFVQPHKKGSGSMVAPSINGKTMRSIMARYFGYLTTEADGTLEVLSSRPFPENYTVVGAVTPQWGLVDVLPGTLTDFWVQLLMVEAPAEYMQLPPGGQTNGATGVTLPNMVNMTSRLSGAGGARANAPPDEPARAQMYIGPGDMPSYNVAARYNDRVIMSHAVLANLTMAVRDAGGTAYYGWNRETPHPWRQPQPLGQAQPAVGLLNCRLSWKPQITPDGVQLRFTWADSAVALSGVVAGVTKALTTGWEYNTAFAPPQIPSSVLTQFAWTRYIDVEEPAPNEPDPLLSGTAGTIQLPRPRGGETDPAARLNRRGGGGSTPAAQPVAGAGASQINAPAGMPQGPSIGQQVSNAITQVAQAAPQVAQVLNAAVGGNPAQAAQALGLPPAVGPMLNMLGGAPGIGGDVGAGLALMGMGV